MLWNSLVTKRNFFLMPATSESAAVNRYVFPDCGHEEPLYAACEPIEAEEDQGEEET
jgi:hypothetical protein